MNRLLLLSIGVFFAAVTYAQKIPLINSGEVIEQAKLLYDSGKYDAAISKFLTVPKRDTNYVYMLTELALSYIAHEQYDKAITTCDEALKNRSTHRGHLLRSKCIALDKKGSYDESVALFKKSIDEYPVDIRLIYNLGITYYNHQEHDKAIDCFFRVLAINPFHAGSHLNLGRISVGHGRKTHAMMSIGMYLGISNEDNERLVYIDKVLSNQIEDEGTLKATDVNSCEKLDQIIRAKLALDKNFKSNLPVDAPVVKQYEMFFQQLNLLPASSQDRWLEYYLPIYKAIKDQGLTETYLYHILSSANNDQVRKWKQKNEKSLNTFFQLANTELSRHREVITVPASLGFDSPVQAWYDDSNRIEAVGKKDSNGKRLGYWLYFNNSLEHSAEGKYNDAGEKAGVWKFYYPDGT
ncbi:MAG TPA: tetratricopeptide repeat protein, partial [Ohtaekwangia sp.]